ncbi:MAG TPA: hypothetical protein PKI60_05875 [Oscillospiraceae bacterium]|nr:hypothetical protein [Oscillospiraceae bacterium]
MKTKLILKSCALMFSAIMLFSACQKASEKASGSLPGVSETTAEDTTVKAEITSETTQQSENDETDTMQETTISETESVSAETTNDKGQTEWDVYYEKLHAFIRSEKVNGISVGTPIDEVKAIFGEPDELSEEEECDDGILQSYCYDKFGPNDWEWGIYIKFERINGIQYVREFAFNISATTSSGVGIGSTRDEIIAAYKDNGLKPYLDYVPYEEWETATIYDKYSLEIGHWKYGGMMFGFDENDIVTSIAVTSGTSI